jgi:hypothetical protein
MVSLLKFLQTKLEVIPGQARNVNINGFTFENLPVYGRDAIILKVLWRYYNEMYVTQEVLGRDTGTEIIKALTKHSKCKTCRSIIIFCSSMTCFHCIQEYDEEIPVHR